MDLALNNLQWLICHKIQTNKQRLKNRYLMPPFLTVCIIRYGSSVRGAVQRKEEGPSQQLGVVAIKKRAFRLPSRTVGHLT